jgi:hypothetical protein
MRIGLHSLDELENEEPVTIDWLLHGKEKFSPDE